MSTLNKKTLKIRGMHCSSCEVLIERKFKAVPGVNKVKVSHSKGEAEIFYTKEPSIEELQSSIKADGYIIHENNETIIKNSFDDYLNIGFIFLILVSLYIILKQFQILPEIGISDNLSYGLVFIIGLVAAVSTCMAVTGGLILAISQKYNENNKNLTSYQKFKPHIYFNLGRIISYTLLGGLIGSLGSVLILSTKIGGFLLIAASLIMILIGTQMLNLFPFLHFLQFKMPKFIAHNIYSKSQSKSAPFMFGASTFFFPCGFTQALQLYVLSQGSFIVGALTMLAFSLGTLPGLVSVGALSSFAKGSFQKYAIKVSAVLIILIGFINISSGLSLTGAAVVLPSNSIGNVAADTNIIDGKQVVEMVISGYEYSPSRFKVKQGVPVEFVIDASRAAGCAHVITIPKLNIIEFLPSQGKKVISFVPKEKGLIPFSCSMGMTTRGAAFEVI
ncbi:MAG: sulfite exporter TauE/SafE family protein [Candidatus Nanoarchaeia archaeon]|nr:sulfite exporter TauE/SafE family protein [Candidatus Nanoarchaeia archaeon]